MAASLRATQVVECGPHQLSHLHMTVERRETPLRFCPTCWTLFGMTGVPLNPVVAPEADARSESRMTDALTPNVKLFLTGSTIVLVVSAILGRLR